MNNESTQLNQAIENLIELRKRLLYSLIGLAIIAVGLLPFCNNIYQFIATPIMHYLPKGSHLVAVDVISPFFVPVKFTLFVAFFLSLPNTIYQFWLFLAPGLYKKEQSLIFGIIISSFILFIMGIIFCYYFVLPMIFHFVTNFKLADIDMMTDIDNYLTFILKLFTIFGIAFETPVLIFILVRMNIIQIQTFYKLRKYIFVGCFIIAAIVTPPDVLSQASFALSLYILYEFGLLISRFIQPSQSD